MFKEIRERIIELSRQFPKLSKAELKEAEVQLEGLERDLQNVVFPRLLDETEKDNPEYQSFKEQSVFDIRGGYKKNC